MFFLKSTEVGSPACLEEPAENWLALSDRRFR